MLQIERNIVAGVFEDRRHADKALSALRAAGFSGDQVRLVGRDVTPVEADAVRVQQEGFAGAWLGTFIGAGVGCGLGILVAVLASAASFGLMIGALVGLLAGAALGVFAGPFLAMEAEGRRLEREPSLPGRTVVLVRTESRQEDAESILVSHGAYDDSMTAR